jgi:hypothetical protein
MGPDLNGYLADADRPNSRLVERALRFAASSPSDQGTYREPWNSTWSAFAISGESEGEPSNGGRETRLGRSNALHIPDYGAVILERVD